jgi:hypothetical protein
VELPLVPVVDALLLLVELLWPEPGRVVVVFVWPGRCGA